MALEYAPIDYLFYPPGEEQVSRTGIIPYAIVEQEGQNGSQELWLLGTLPSGRLSDFGGSCLVTQGELPFECVIREVDEESNGLLTEEVRQTLEAAHELAVEQDQQVSNVHVWRWVNRNRPEDTQYLIFAEVDYNALADIEQQFTGNEENTRIAWFDKEDLLENTTVEEFNTSIQKFLRRFGFMSQRSPRRRTQQ